MEGSNFISLHPNSHSLLQQVHSDLCFSPSITYTCQCILSPAYSLTLMMKAAEPLKHQYILTRLHGITSQKTTIFKAGAFSFHKTKAISLPKSDKPSRMSSYTQFLVKHFTLSHDNREILQKLFTPTRHNPFQQGFVHISSLLLV